MTKKPRQSKEERTADSARWKEYVAKKKCRTEKNLIVKLRRMKWKSCFLNNAGRNDLVRVLDERMGMAERMTKKNISDALLSIKGLPCAMSVANRVKQLGARYCPDKYLSMPRKEKKTQPPEKKTQPPEKKQWVTARSATRSMTYLGKKYREERAKQKEEKEKKIVEQVAKEEKKKIVEQVAKEEKKVEQVANKMIDKIDATIEKNKQTNNPAKVVKKKIENIVSEGFQVTWPNQEQKPVKRVLAPIITNPKDRRTLESLRNKNPIPFHKRYAEMYKKPFIPIIK